MSNPRPITVVGFLGTTLDRGRRPNRWERWRPTVSLCQHEDLLVSRLVLFASKRDGELARQIREDVEQVSPETTVEVQPMELRDPWDFEEVFGALHDFARSFEWDPDHHDYLVHITTGSHVAQICLFLLTETRHFPARLIQSSPPSRQEAPSPAPTRSSTSTCRATTASRRATRPNAKKACRS